MMKNQITPNYMNKLKMKKTEAKKPAKFKLLNLQVPIKPED
jgi:hypothetical protein